MAQTFQELVFGDALIAPIIFYGLVTIAAILVLRPILHFVGFAKLFSNAPVAELSLYIAIFGLLTLLL